MFKQTITFLFLAFATSTLATNVLIPKQTGAITGASASVGPVVLSNDNEYLFNIPFEIDMGTGTAAFGFASNVTVMSNKNPGCNSLSTITAAITTKFIVPTAITSGLSTVCAVVTCPPYEDLLKGFEWAYVYNLTQLTPPFANVEMKLSDVAPAQYKTALKFLGTDATITLMLQNLTTFKAGMEIPMSYTVEVIKKSIMEFPTAVCGNRGKFPCGSQSCVYVGTSAPLCVACATYCTAVGTAIDAALPGTGNAAVYDKTEDLLSIFKTVAGSDAAKQAGFAKCKGASSYECVSIGDTTTQCPKGSKFSAAAAAAADKAAADAAAKKKAAATTTTAANSLGDDSGAGTIVQNTAALMAVMAIALQLL